MSSRQLLTLLDGLPDESTFKTWALRGGDWHEGQYMQARMINEISLSRADGKGYMPQLMKSPFQIAAEQAEDDYRVSRHAENMKQLQGRRDDSGDNA